MPPDSIVVIGGGIVGLATAYHAQLARPAARVVVVEKEDRLAAHQTGRNSGVLHSGVYYKPRSLKAVNCRRGKALIEQFCREHGLPFEICGKVIVATRDDELPTLASIQDRARHNGVACEHLGPRDLRRIEPHAAGIAALRIPEAGIIDFIAVCARLGELIERRGGEVRLRTRVLAIDERPTGAVVRTTAGDLAASAVVNCAGLHSDRVTAMTAPPPAKIIPFRGEYYELTPDARELCRNLIYPVPDPRFPFLGVHFTRMIAGGVECGPNAVLALAREGYTWSDVDLDDLADALGYPAFWKLAARHWRMGLGEIHRSLSKRAFTRALQRLIPEIREHHLEPAPSGVRAQALAPDGALVDDFLIVRAERVINVCNAPSPAATGALAIGETVAGMLPP
ncbi:MAG TPA: L-2-hydroxyglutarate oxidase [Phycisphaerales bacterium]|nr:L-2-hydroxyglutarate oxidase [Phycisphaerales bacterium]